MKKYFITGLVILLPLTLTLWVVSFVFNLLTQPFLGITNSILNYYNLFNNPELQAILSKILIIIVLFVFTVFLGFVARWIFVHYMIHFWEHLIHRIPFVSTIYKASQDIIQTIFSKDANAFKKVVMIPFPTPESRTLGLVTVETLSGLSDNLSDGDHMVVFVPTTPNPTSGFLVIVKKDSVIPVDMKVEDAFKFIISCGVITTPLKKQDE